MNSPCRGTNTSKPSDRSASSHRNRGRDERHVAGQADDPLGGRRQDRRVEADGRAGVGQGVVDHRQTQVVEPRGLAGHDEDVREERGEPVAHPLDEGLAAEGREDLVLAHPDGAAAGQQGQAHVGAVGLPERCSCLVSLRRAGSAARPGEITAPEARVEQRQSDYDRQTATRAGSTHTCTGAPGASARRATSGGRTKTVNTQAASPRPPASPA